MPIWPQTLIEENVTPGAVYGLTTVKASTCPVQLVSSTYTVVDGEFRVYAIYLPKAATLTGVGWLQTTAGDTTQDNNNKIGLFNSDGTNLVRVAQSTDDGTLWEGAAGTKQKAFSATYSAAPGVYWIGMLANWSAVATAPVIGAASQVTGNVHSGLPGLPANHMLSCALAAQTDLPSSTAWTGMGTVSGRVPYLFVY